jgi:hypothetical protein
MTPSRSIKKKQIECFKVDLFEGCFSTVFYEVINFLRKKDCRRKTRLWDDLISLKKSKKRTKD